MIKLVYQRPKNTQPATDDADKLADYDLQFLLEHLASERGTEYREIERPDRTERNARKPDYLVYEVGTGRKLAVERKQLLDPRREAGRARAIRQGADVIIEGPINFRPERACELLRQSIANILARGQLLGVDADERILLLRNRLDATKGTFLRAPNCLCGVGREGIDHAYLICDRFLLRLW